MRYPNMEAERKRMGISRQQAANRIGVTRDVYCAWVDGEYPIPSNFCRLIANLYGCSLDYLLAPTRINERWKRYRSIF